MKKILSLLMIFAMLTAVTGCSFSSDKSVVNFSSALSDGKISDDCDISIDSEGFWESEEIALGSDTVSGENSQAQNVIAGTLTAGEWRDSDNQDFWRSLLNRNDWYQLMVERNLYTNNIITVYIHDEEGNPCFNVMTQLTGSDGQTIYTARTDINGMAYMLYNLNNTGETAVSVLVNNQEFLLQDNRELDISVKDLGMDVKELDLMLMIDTTGSMHDELSYLQEELKDVVKRVADKDEALSINISVNFYRDETDDYVVLSYDFDDDISKCLEQLKEQEADGGGDYPEAVHKALNNAVNEHQWRNDAVKLCFLVLDAPPHNESDISGINARIQGYVQDAAKEGIRIIPVASSGVDTETEFLLRSFALMTGGTYIFLTDDSGVGDSHLEPTIGEYEVEALNELMIRVISEYCGLEYTAPAAEQQ